MTYFSHRKRTRRRELLAKRFTKLLTWAEEDELKQLQLDWNNHLQEIEQNRKNLKAHREEQDWT